MMNPGDSERALLVDAMELRASQGGAISSEEWSNLRNSAYSRNCRIFRDALSRPVGYVAWANINKASFSRLMKSGQYPTYPYEWNEGGICLILDVFIAERGRYDALRQLRPFLRSRRLIVFRRSTRGIRCYRRRAGQLRRFRAGGSAVDTRSRPLRGAEFEDVTARGKQDS